MMLMVVLKLVSPSLQETLSSTADEEATVVASRCYADFRERVWGWHNGMAF